MARLLFKCPRCGAENEITLEHSASMLLLSCGECHCPLMYFSGQAFEIDESEFHLLQNRQMKAVEGFLKIHRAGRRPIAAASQGARALPAQHKAGEPVREQYIGPDDITDLVIDLETSEDVEDFLKRIG